MAQPPFPRWADHALRAFIAGAAVAAALLVALAFAAPRSPYVTGEGDPRAQPIAFDHRHHVGDDGIDCRYCHWSAERSRWAGIPATDVCMNCHGQIWNRSDATAAVRASWAENKPIAWTRVHRLPDFVFFDHAKHVTKGVGCAECHGRVDHMARVMQVAPLTMGWCLDCHRDPEPRLRPLAKITDPSWTADDRRAVGHAVAAAVGGVQPPTSCSGCHR